MAYRKLFSSIPGEFAKNTQLAVHFLVEQFGAIQRKHPFHENIVVINGKSWWVIPATSNQGVDLCNGRDEDPLDLVMHIKKLQSGILIIRQLGDNRICVYEISNLDTLTQRLESSLILLWDTIEIIKSGSDIGIMIGDELIGFRKLRNQPGTATAPTSKPTADV